MARWRVTASSPHDVEQESEQVVEHGGDRAAVGDRGGADVAGVEAVVGVDAAVGVASIV
ncbi:Uncharacterised protein [Nocardia cyriacigeorgica]|uniref:Uncharacterized protein n=1 Tax=Nocardia cyriacigeorgica TaxID=135487 RepID=A0A4V6ICJ7_9NOCA|nr:Uncharacterised protein [Nocardia cyriacigeorgica]